MKYTELSEFQAKTLIDAKQLYQAVLSARREIAAYQGSMHWKTVSGGAYLIKSVRGAQRGIGPRSPETEAIYRAFVNGKESAQAQAKSLARRVFEHARVCRAAQINRVPVTPSKILRILDSHGLLGKKLLVIGTNALFAYEAASGVLFDSAVMATADFDLMMDVRAKIKIAVSEKMPEGGLMALLKKADSSFVPVYERGFRARNRDGYFVDIVKPEPAPPRRDEPSNLAPGDTLEASLIKSLKWLLSSPRFSDVALGADGFPVPIVCPDPRAYALHKIWMASQMDRDPLKKGRDRAQAIAVASMVVDRLPHLRFSADDLRNFPKEITNIVDDGEIERLARSFGFSWH